MSELRFYGASDDLVEVEGVFSEEYATTDATFLVVAPTGNQAFVRVRYERGGVWSACLYPADEDVPLPPARIELHERGYSAVLILDVPDKTKVHEVKAADYE